MHSFAIDNLILLGCEAFTRNVKLKIKVVQCDVKLIMGSFHLNILIFASPNPLGAYFCIS